MLHPLARTTARRSLAGSALAILVLASAACTSGGGPAPLASSPPVVATATPGSTPSSTPSASPAPSPTASSPRALPAAGPVVKRTTFSLRVPEGYTVDKPHHTYTGAGSEDACGGIMAMEMSSRRTPPLSWLVKSSLNDPQWNRKPKRLANVTIAGRTWYRVHGQAHWSADFPHIDTYEFGTAARGMAVLLQLQFDTDAECTSSVAERQAVVSSVIATVRWR